MIAASRHGYAAEQRQALRESIEMAILEWTAALALARKSDGIAWHTHALKALARAAELAAIDPPLARSLSDYHLVESAIARLMGA